MMKYRILKDKIGNSYEVLEGPTGLKKKLKRFDDIESARRFVRQLDMQEEALHVLSSLACHTSPPYGAETNPALESLTRMLWRGELRVAEIVTSIRTSGARSVNAVKTRDGSAFEFLPVFSVIGDTPSNTQKFNDPADVEQFILKLSLTDQEIVELGKQLDAPSVNSPQPLQNKNKIIKELGKSIAEGDIIVTMEKASAGASSSGSSTSYEQHDEASDIPGNRKANLGPESDNSSEKQDKQPECEFSLFEVKCSHAGSRGYSLDVINSDLNFNDNAKVLRVVGEDSIVVNFSGSCGFGKSDCPSIDVSGPQGSKNVKKGPLKFSADPKPVNKPVNSFSDFLKDWVVPNFPSLDYQTYKLKNCGCTEVEKHQAEVHVFPKMKWGGKVEFGYVTKSGEKERNEQNLGEKGQWKLVAGLSGNIGSESWSLSTENSNDAKSYFPGLLNSVKDFIDKVDEIAESRTPKLKDEKDLGLLKFKFGYPNVVLDGGVELQECNGSTDVGIGGSISLEMNPLLKAEVRTDVLDWIIGISGPHGPLLREIKKKAAEGVKSKYAEGKAVVAVDIVLDGSVAGGFKWEKNAADEWISTKGDKQGNLKVGLSVGIEAKVKVEAKIFYVKICLGAEFHVKSDEGADQGIGVYLNLFATTKDDYPALGGQFGFTGCALYYTYYAEVGVESSSSDENNSNRRRSKGGAGGMKVSESKTEAKSSEKEMNKIVTLFKPAKWPDWDSKNEDEGVVFNEIKF